MSANSQEKLPRKGASTIVGKLCLLLARVLLGTILLWSGIIKTLQPYDFLGDVYAYELTGAVGGVLVAMVLPWFEILLSICLLLGLRPRSTFLFATGLMGLFVFLQYSALGRGLQISCGCFGNAVGDPHDHIDKSSLWRTAILAIIAGLAYAAATLLKPNVGGKLANWH